MKKNPTNEEYLQLMRKWNSSDCQTEKNQIATIILKGLEKLMWMLVRKRSNWISDAMMEDCYAEACLVIIKSAMPNFDESKMKNVKFSNYCANWITHAITRAIEGSDSVVHIPINGRKEALKSLRAGAVLSAKEQAYLPGIIYWDKPAENQNSDGQKTLREVMCVNEGIFTNPVGIEQLHVQRREALARELIEGIDCARDRRIVEGILNGMTLRDIGDEVGLSRQGASNAFNKQIDIMRQKLKAEKEAVRNAKYKRPEEVKVKRIKVVDRTTKKSKPDKNGITKDCRETVHRRAAKRRTTNVLAMD